MSATVNSQNTSSSCSETLAEMIFLPSFTLAISIGPLAIYSLSTHYTTAFEVVTTLGVIAMAIVALLSGTQYMRLHALAAKNKAQEKIRIEQAAGLPIAPMDAEAAEKEIPTYRELLRRNGVAAIFYIPLVLIVGVPAAFIMIGGMASTDKGTRQNGVDFLLVLMVAYPAILILGWRFITRLVDTRLLKRKIDLPLSEEQRLKKEEANHQTTLRHKLVFYAIRIVGGIVGFVLPLVPLLFLPSITNAEIPAIAKGVGVAGLFLVAYGVPFLLIRRFAFPALQKRYINTVKEKAETLKVTATPEENLAIEQVVTQIENQQRIQKNSLESQIQGRLSIIFIGTIMLSLFIGVGVAAAVRSAGASADASKMGFIVVVGIGILLALFVLPRLYMRYFMATSKLVKAMQQIEEFTRRGEYAQAFPLIEEQLRESPSYEVLMAAAAVYAQAGNNEEGERLTREALRELANTNSEQTREMRKPFMANAFGLLGEIQNYAGKRDEARQSIEQAHTFGTNYALENSTARLELIEGNSGKAHSFLDAAVKAYRKDKKQPSPYHHSLRAWAFALQGENTQADTLIQQAFAQAKPEHRADLAELYLIQGYTFRAQRKTLAATQAFERAIDHDPNGASGKIARLEREQG